MFRLTKNRHFREDTWIFVPNILCHKKEALFMVWWIECYFYLILNFTSKIWKKPLRCYLITFPLPFIFSTINKRIKQLSYKENNFNKEDKEVKKSDRIKFFTIPYVNSVSEGFLPVCGRFGFSMSYSILNTLKRYIKQGKDGLDVRTMMLSIKSIAMIVRRHT